ncbi:hypothetical protein [Rhizobacter sp. Root1221]|uniref:hypothetical protein n=1 Tax=Rhizobacter sp. Root1221 TaxID=1736433 RepID=UPI0012F74EF5|nr:hypothetical protein [Rhizobacter sp. Root1221]
MSRHVEQWVISAVVSCAAASAHAQTIGDYSRAQRAVIESTIARSALRPSSGGPVGLPALPQAAASAPLVPLPQAAPPRRDMPEESSAPQVAVTGVVVTPNKALAEVVVDGVAYMLSAGQSVPGTPMTVATVAADRVVLSGARGMRGPRTYPVANMGP